MEQVKEKKISKKKLILKVIIFVVIGSLLFLYLNEVFNISNSDSNKKIFSAFYAQEENTIDVVYFGTSATNRYFIGPKAYEESGITVFDLATMGMPLFFIPTLIEEVEKTQSPQLYIIELRWLFKDKDMVTDAHIRRVTDSMKYSGNRTEAINKALEFTEGAEGELSDVSDNVLDYYIPIIKYHSRLETGDLNFSDVILFQGKNKTKGFVVSPKTLQQVPQEESSYSEKKLKLAPETEDVLEEVLDYCDGLENKEVLFVLSPYSVKKEEIEVLNAAVDTVKDRGYDILNFNTKEMTETLDIDWKEDFYNRKHVNFLGAEKYTEYLTTYLMDNYDLADHRGEAEYESWDEAYEHYMEFVKDGIERE